MVRSTTGALLPRPQRSDGGQARSDLELESWDRIAQFHGHRFTVSKLCVEGAVGFVLDVDRTRLLARWSDLVGRSGPDRYAVDWRLWNGCVKKQTPIETTLIVLPNSAASMTATVSRPWRYQSRDGNVRVRVIGVAEAMATADSCRFGNLGGLRRSTLSKIASIICPWFWA